MSFKFSIKFSLNEIGFKNGLLGVRRSLAIFWEGKYKFCPGEAVENRMRYCLAGTEFVFSFPKNR